MSVIIRETLRTLWRIGTLFLSHSEIWLDKLWVSVPLPSCPLRATRLWSPIITPGASDWLLACLVEGADQRLEPALCLYFLHSMSAGLD
jgi:hypothetical protein